MPMKLPFFSPGRLIAAAVIGAGLFASVPEAQARDHGPSRGPSRGWFGRGDRHDHDHRRGDDRSRFFAHPRSSWAITLGNGYAGRGYYYGPPDAAYYYQGSGVAYYASRDRVPYDYWRGARLADLNAAVQSELRRRGYYRGPVDGRLGPGSKAAISRYQSSRGLAVTGNVNNQTLRALGIR